MRRTTTAISRCPRLSAQGTVGAVLIVISLFLIGVARIDTLSAVSPRSSTSPSPVAKLGEVGGRASVPVASNREWNAPAAERAVQRDLAQRCSKQASTFEPLGTFKFWGKLMNDTDPCPTSGMNNQFTMLVALTHCALTSSPTGGAFPGRLFRFKDISCSPTGGREGRTKFVVGSTDYEYAWFRWTEVLNLTRGLAAARRQLLPAAGVSEAAAVWPLVCLADNYSWSEHSAMRGCNTNIGHLYGTASYWAARRVFPFRDEYHALAKCFFRWAAAGADPASAPRAWRACSMNGGVDSDREPAASTAAVVTLGLHVRRGDYEGFCRGIVGNSGKTKFRTPPFLFYRRNSTAFASSKHVMRACAPDDAAVLVGTASAVRRLLTTLTEASARPVVMIIVAVATNSPTLEAVVRASLAKHVAADQSAKVTLIVTSMRSFTAAAAAESGSPPAWPSGLRRSLPSHDNEFPLPPPALASGPAAAAAAGGARMRLLSTTDLVTLDMTVLARADGAVLNRYSTFSQTAIDERIVRAGHERQPYHENDDSTMAAALDVAGLQLFWW